MTVKELTRKDVLIEKLIRHLDGVVINTDKRYAIATTISEMIDEAIRESKGTTGASGRVAPL